MWASLCFVLWKLTLRPTCKCVFVCLSVQPVLKSRDGQVLNKNWVAECAWVCTSGPLVEFTLRLLACQVRVSVGHRLTSLLLCLCDVLWVLITPLVCWFLFPFVWSSWLGVKQQLTYIVWSSLGESAESIFWWQRSLPFAQWVLLFLSVIFGLMSSHRYVHMVTDEPLG